MLRRSVLGTNGLFSFPGKHSPRENRCLVDRRNSSRPCRSIRMRARPSARSRPACSTCPIGRSSNQPRKSRPSRRRNSIKSKRNFERSKRNVPVTVRATTDSGRRPYDLNLVLHSNPILENKCDWKMPWSVKRPTRNSSPTMRTRMPPTNRRLIWPLSREWYHDASLA